ncbi:MAG: ROK family protein [Erysipelotrichaceae bacterium]
MRILCVDVGGTDIKYAVLDQELNFHEKGKVATPTTNFSDFENILVALYQKYDVEGLALSMPGIIDSDSGYLFTGGAIPYNYRVNIFEALAKHGITNITVENDAKAAALAEARYGALKEVKDGVVVILGTGIGGGIIMDGKLRKGSHYSAGEFSPIGVKSGEKWQDWTTVASTTALVYKICGELQLPKSEWNGHTVFKLIKEHNAVALRIFEKYCYQIAEQLMNFQLILDPTLIAIGGGISNQDILIEEINKQIDKVFEFHVPAFPKPKIVVCHFRSDANLIGALSCYLDKYTK